MKPETAIVQSVFDFAIREINALERRGVQGEDEADEVFWEQARQVVALLERGFSQQDLAAQWINARTGEPYSQKHVSRTKLVVQTFTSEPRPRFRDAYNEIANAKSKQKLAVHHSSETPEHYTPAEFLEYVYRVFDGIPDLDPCCESSEHPNVPAVQHYTRADDGLAQPWFGRLFMNPPYGRALPDWIRKLREEWTRGEITEAIALLPARTDTDWFEALTVDTDDAIVCLLNGRLTFVGNEDAAPFPSMVVYFGPRHDRFAEVFVEIGSLWQRPGRPLEWFVSRET